MDTRITLHHDQPARPVDIEWRWTGFTPARLLLNDDMRQTLRYLGSLPRNAVRYVRIHWLLELVTAKNLGTERPLYDWSKLDAGLDALVENNLVPFFELMGNPSGYFTDYKQPVQAGAWRRLICDLALHCMDRYGYEVVESWYFETWNEPDVGWWKQDDAAFLIYYDACSEGLRDANPKLRFGGPGSAHTLSPVIRKLLAHVDTGTHYFTGKQDVRMDFLSVHEKGAWASHTDVPVSPEKIIAHTRQLLDYLREHHPRLLSIPLMNNECDPQVGWKDPHTWRGLPFYAAIMAKALVQHFHEFRDRDDVPFRILGNDNGFIGDWTQRTQLARIAVPGFEESRFELVKKPALALMTGLSLLGEERVPATVEGNDRAFALGTSLGEEGYAAVLCHAANRPRLGGNGRMALKWEGVRPGAYRIVHYRIDENHSNPFRAWEDSLEDASRRALPGREVFDRLRRNQELDRFGGFADYTVGDDGRFHFDADFPLPCVHFTLLLRKDAFGEPGRVSGLRIEPCHGTGADVPVLVTWKPLASRAIVDHRVEVAAGDGCWEEIGHAPLLDGSLVHALEVLPRRLRFRVTAIDAWGRSGPAAEAEWTGD